MTADVTIVCATYNRPEYLRVELESILAAAARVPKIKVRILVVDDHSDTMNAKNVAYDLQVDYLRLKENRGVAGTLVAGFEEVDSPYYALWGDDDFFLPNWFQRHLSKMAEGFDVVSGSYWRTDAHLNRKKRAVILEPPTLADLRQGRNSCNDGALVRRSEAVPFRPEFGRAMMLNFWTRMAAKGAKFGSVQEATWLYRRHPGQLTAKPLTEHEKAQRLAAVAPEPEPAWIEAFG
jgi:glycosyltransferase involved in cell wall biosynthesis